MARIIGIDFGTSSTQVAMNRNGSFNLAVKNTDVSTPGWIGQLPDGGFLYGAAADPGGKQVISVPLQRLKRLLGQRQEIQFGANLYSPVELTGFFLKHVLNQTSYPDEPAQAQAVITVPSAVGSFYRLQLKEAGLIAGLKAVRLLSESTAAMMDFSVEYPGYKNVLVYCLGAGYFEVSLMSFVRNTPEMIWVEAEEGNAGDHFDRLILDRLLSSLGVQPAEFLSRITPQNSWKMLKITEEAKIALAQQEEIPVNLFADDRTMSQSRVLSRQEFEGLIQPSLEKHFTTIDQAFSASDLAADDLDAVAIVGGSTRIPYLNQRLVEKYRKPVVTILEEKVVLGAAHYAEMIQAELSEEASRQDRRQPERNQPAPVKVIQPPSSLIAAPALPRQEPTQSLSGLEWVKKQIDQGNIGQALQRYPCDKKKPQYVDIYRALGKELNQQAVHYMNQGGIPQEAQKRLELALTYFPENETIRKNLTTLYHQDAINFLETKQWNNLFQLVDKIHTVQLNPLWLHEFQYPLVEEIVRQAQRCEKKGEWEKAVEWLKQGLSVQFATDQLRVKLADTYEKWGIFLKEKNDYQAARECFIQGLNYLPNHAGMIKELQQFQKSKRHRKR